MVHTQNILTFFELYYVFEIFEFEFINFVGFM